MSDVSAISVPPLTSLIMDYAPEEAGWVVATGPGHDLPGTQEWFEDRGYLYSVAKVNQEVHLFFKLFDLHFRLFEIEVAKGDPQMRGPREAVIPENAAHPDYARIQEDRRRRAYEGRSRGAASPFDASLHRYREIAILIALNAPQINAWFGRRDFMHDRWGFGYLRPSVELMPYFSYDNEENPQFNDFTADSSLTHERRGELQRTVERLYPPLHAGTWLKSYRRQHSSYINGRERYQGVMADAEWNQRWQHVRKDYERIISHGCGVAFNFLKYTPERYRQTAWTMARMLCEAGVKPHLTMINNARSDGITEVRLLIDAPPISVQDLTTLIMDYVPEETAWLVTRGKDAQNRLYKEAKGYVYKAAANSRGVQLFLDYFRLHTGLFLREVANQGDANYPRGGKLVPEDRAHPAYALVQAARALDTVDRVTPPFDRALNRYQMTAHVLAVKAPQIRAWFARPDFMHGRWGYGYVRPGVELMPCFSIREGDPQFKWFEEDHIPSEQVTALQARVVRLFPALDSGEFQRGHEETTKLNPNIGKRYEKIISHDGTGVSFEFLAYTPERYSQTAWTMANMLWEAAILPNQGMIENAIHDEGEMRIEVLK